MDPDRLARFYAEAHHYKLQDPPEGNETWERWLVPEAEWNSASAIVDPSAKGPRIYFQQMDTPKLGKNGLHIDMNLSEGSRVAHEARKKQVNSEVDRIVRFGASKDHELDENGEYCVIMLDPEGNEFCVQ